MVNREEELYNNIKGEIEFIEKGLHKEDLSASETIAVSSLQRQKANLQSRKTKMQQEMEELDQEIASIDARIASMRAT